MMFSQHTIAAAQTGFTRMLQRSGPVLEQKITKQLEEVQRSQPADVLTAVQWLYAHSPLSDWANYDFSLFLSCAGHAVFLRENSPLAKEVPEDIFLHYILHIRVNTEALCDCRRFFYDLVAERVEGLSPADAVLAVNYWNAEHVTYQSTDTRTISPLGAYRSAYGRCGEESTFAVNVFRSVGIPARQVYTPFWAHCDDNHAWVEVWCGGSWHFLGACEPEEVLDHGWFTNAASRAMLVHSRCFGDIAGEEIISRVGIIAFLNHLRRYAPAKKLTVTVRDPEGRPVPGAQVCFGILNYSTIFDVAEMVTDRDGEVSLTCGLGSINVRARKGGVSVEQMVFAPESDRVELVLEERAPSFGIWEDFIVTAPRDRGPCGVRPTREQKDLGQKKLAAANGKRERRAAAMFDSRQASAVVADYGYSHKIYDILLESRGNFESLLLFLKDPAFSSEEKENILLSLSKKDWRDVDIGILQEALDTTRGYTAPLPELFYPYIVCPRVWNEPLSLNRRFLLDYFSSEEKRTFQAAPEKIWDYIQLHIAWDPSGEYSQLITLPAGALTVKNANPPSQKILFVSICRALGIPARVNPVDHAAEYYRDGRFVPVEIQEPGKCSIILEKEPGETWLFERDFGLAALADGAYQALDLKGVSWEGNHLKVAVPSGIYRIITDNRLPCGDIHASKYHIHLAEGTSQTVKLRKYSADLSQLLVHYPLDDFMVTDLSGCQVSGRQLTESGKAIFLWLEEGAEPTEHILDEMLARASEFERLSAEIIFLVQRRDALENLKLRKVLDRLPRIRVYTDDFVPNAEALARRTYVDPDKLPLIIVTDSGLNAIYACSGYNAGSSDMLLRICG